MKNFGCRLCRRLIIAPTVLTDILVLINVGHGFIRAVSGIVIVVDC